MIYIDLTYKGRQEGIKSLPLSHIPKFKDGESYYLSGHHHGYFNIDRQGVKLYGDMLLTANSGKAMRIEAPDVEIYGLHAHGINAHAVQCVSGCKNLMTKGMKLTTNGYQYDGMNYQGEYPLRILDPDISHVQAGLQLQTDSDPDTLIVKGGWIRDTQPLDIGGNGDGIFVGGQKRKEIDFEGKLLISGVLMEQIGENAIDFANVVNGRAEGNVLIGGHTAINLGWNKGGGHNNVATKNLISHFKIAVNTRGGYDCEVFYNDIQYCELGFWIDKMIDAYKNRFKQTQEEYRIASGVAAKINGNLVRA